jgi:hypothetical protein
MNVNHSAVISLPLLAARSAENMKTRFSKKKREQRRREGLDIDSDTRFFTSAKRFRHYEH